MEGMLVQSPWAAFSPWEGTRGGSSILLFLTPCPEKGYLPKKTLQGTKKAKGIHDDTGDKRQAGGLGERLAPMGACSLVAQQEGTLLGGFGRAGRAAGSQEYGRSRKTPRGDGAFTWKRQSGFSGVPALLTPF